MWSVLDFPRAWGLGSLPEPPVPTGEIHPGMKAPEAIAKLEFARQRAAQSDRALESERGGRPDSGRDQSIDERLESDKGEH